jgi:hypothetical protein
MVKEYDLNALGDAIEAVTVNIRKRATKTVWKMANELKDQVEETVMEEDEHTPKWLKRNAHPYRHTNLHGKKPIVHVQPDEDKRGKTSEIHLWENIEIFESNRKDELQVGVDPEKVPYVEAVLFGTKKMIARDFLAWSLLKKRKRFMKIIKKDMTSKKSGETNIANLKEFKTKRQGKPRKMK